MAHSGGLETISSDANVLTAVRHSTCSDLQGATYTDACGASYEVECYKDRFGGVIGGPVTGPIATYSFEACLYRCGATAVCVGVAWVQGFPMGTCYLKSELGPQVDDMAAWGAKQLSGCTSEVPAPNPL